MARTPTAPNPGPSAAPAAPATATAPRPADLGEDELAARLRVAVTRLSRRLRQQSLGGLSPSQVSLLGAVDRLASPTLGELAAIEQVQPPTMTRLVSALEEAGLLGRAADATDRRVSRVHLTVEGRRRLQRVRSLKTAFLTRGVAQLSDGEREELHRLVDLLERLAEPL